MKTQLRRWLAAIAAIALVGMVGSQVARAAIMSDYLENKIVDWLVRGQSFTPPATVHVGLATSACSDSATGTEVSGGSYARVAVSSSLANWAGTQSAGSTSASSGTGGTTSNNGDVQFAAPSANWGVITHVILMDASTSGNLLFCIALTASKTINNGDAAPKFPAATLSIQADN